MSRFLSPKYAGLEPYTPGEQFREKGWIKLNTNESPFAPPRRVVERASEAAENLQLYCDPDAGDLRRLLADHLSVHQNQLLLTNGSDEILHFAFMAFCDENKPAVFPDITYGFYKVFADLEGVPSVIVPLKEDLSVDPEDYCGASGRDPNCGASGTLFLANPNANTGIALSLDDIGKILASDPDRVVVIDEAYIDFGAESALPLLDRYDNLLITRTFSKGWSMAGARLGFGIGSADLIDDLNRIKYSTDPYNVNSMTQAAGIGALEAYDEIAAGCRLIADTREWFTRELAERGFEMTPSSANFVFARHGTVDGKTLYEELKARKILVRHFDKERISDRIRITIGSRDDMEELLVEIDDILEV